jgi:hypothetical protein
MRIARDPGGQHLQRNNALEARVEGSVDLAHAPCTNDCLDLVRSETRTGRQAHARAPPNAARICASEGGCNTFCAANISACGYTVLRIRSAAAARS